MVSVILSICNVSEAVGGAIILLPQMEEPTGAILTAYSSLKLLDDQSPFIYGDGLPLVRYFTHPGRVPNRSNYHDLQLVRLNNKYTIASSDCQAQLISHQTCGSALGVQVKTHQIITFSKPILSVYTNWPMSNSISLTVLVLEGEMMLFSIDVKEEKMIKKAQLRISGVSCLSFVNSAVFYLLTDNRFLWEFDCSNFLLLLRHKISANLEQGGEYGSIRRSAIIAEFSSVSDYPVTIIYSSALTQPQGVVETLLVKEFTRKHKTIEEGQFFMIRQCEQTFSEVFRVIQFRRAICINLSDQIVILNKQHSSYYILDSIRQRLPNSSMILLHDGTLFTVSEDRVEKAIVTIEDSMCTVELQDVIRMAPVPEYHFFYLVPIQKNYLFFLKKTTGSQQIKFTHTHRIDALSKLMDLVDHGMSVQQAYLVGQKLNITRYDFYLLLWSRSQKLVDDILTKLFQTNDPLKIKSELVLSLRHKKIMLGDFSGMILRLHLLIKNQLKKTMTSQLLNEYIRTDFLLKKIKIQPELDTLIGYNEYVNIKQQSVLSLMTETILNEKSISHMTLRQKQRNLKQPIFKNSAIMRDVLSELRFVLLDHYQRDLIQLLRSLGECLPYVLDRFNYLLPNYPYKFQFKTYDQLRIEVEKNSEDKALEVSNGVRQPKLFCALREPDWDQQISVEQIVKFYSDFHPTSVVEGQLQKVLSSYNFENERLQRHGLIMESKKEYVEKMEKMSGIKLYLKVCEFGNLYNVSKLDELKRKEKERKDLERQEAQVFREERRQRKSFDRHERSLSKSAHKKLSDSRDSRNKSSSREIHSETLVSFQQIEQKDIYQVIVDEEKQMDDLPGTLVETFQLQNKLEGEDFFKCKFYAKLHLLIHKHKVHSEISMDQLVNMLHQDVVALFFLGNRRKIDMVFQELKDIYDQLPGGDAFPKAMTHFVKSDNCSPVELGFLVQCINRQGRYFQEKNQDLIGILIDGYATRYCVNQTSNINQLINQLFHQIWLNQLLSERMIKFLKIGEMSSFLAVFNCQEERLLVVENQGHIILSRILQNYFTGCINEVQIVICEQKVNLSIPRNMLNVLLYLQQQLYDHLSQWDVLLIFGDRLIDYSVFEVLMELVNEEDTMTMLDVDPVEYTQVLMNEALSKIFDNQKGRQFKEVQQHLNNILRLHIEQTPEYLSKQAQVRLCRLITHYNKQSFSHTIFDIIHLSDTQEFIINFIQQCSQELTLTDLVEVYKCFEVIDSEDEGVKNEGIGYVSFWTKTMLRKKLVEKGLEGVGYLVEREYVYEIHDLTTESLLQVLNNKYEHKGEIGQSFIEFYVLNYANKQEIQGLFQSKMSVESIISFQTEGEKITIHPSLLYMDLKGQLLLKEVSNLLESEYPEESTAQFYRDYLFLIAVISNPELGFNIKGIDYDYNRLDKLLEIVSDKVLTPSVHHASRGINLNQYNLRFMFLKGLVRANCALLEQPVFEIHTSINLNDEIVEYTNLCNELKAEYPENYKVMRRCQKYLQENHSQHLVKARKAHKYKEELRKEMEKQLQVEKTMKRELEELHAKSFTEQNKMDKTMPLKEYLREARNLSTMYYPSLPDRQVMSMIWDSERSLSPQRRTEREKQRELKGTETKQSPLKITIEQEDLGITVYSLFQSSNFKQLLTYTQPDLIAHLQCYYNTKVTNQNFSNFLNLLTTLKIGEEPNIAIAKNASRLMTPLEFSSLFPFSFFFHKPEPTSTPKEYFIQILKFLTPVIRAIINEHNYITISKIIYTCYKPFDKELEYEVYLIGFQKLVESMDTMEGRDTDMYDEYVRKMATSASFVGKNYEKMAEICWRSPKHLQESLLQHLATNLKSEGTPRKEKAQIEELIERISDSVTAT